MSQNVGALTSAGPTFPGGGQMLGPGVNGPIVNFWGTGDPNTGVQITGVIDLTDADVGSTYRRNDVVDSTHQFYVKTGFTLGAAGTWTNK
jgi:hypothetical protein